MREGGQCRARVLAGGGGVGWRIAAAAGRAARTAPGRSCFPADCMGEWVRWPCPSGDVRVSSWRQPGWRPPLRPARWLPGRLGMLLRCLPVPFSPSPGHVRTARSLSPPPPRYPSLRRPQCLARPHPQTPSARGWFHSRCPSGLAPAVGSPTSPPVPAPVGSSEAAGSLGLLPALLQPGDTGVRVDLGRCSLLSSCVCCTP